MHQAAALGLDAGRMAVGGDSAGGNLAAVVALAWRDDAGGRPPLRLQLLIYPATDMRAVAPSHTHNGQGYLLTSDTIACGAGSGFHALISSGTTPKLLENETHARYIGYGGMLAESFVAVMALVAASCIEPGIYFAMNSPAAVVGKDAASVAQTLSTWGFVVTPEMLTQAASARCRPSASCC